MEFFICFFQKHFYLVSSCSYFMFHIIYNWSVIASSFKPGVTYKANELSFTYTRRICPFYNFYRIFKYDSLQNSYIIYILCFMIYFFLKGSVERMILQFTSHIILCLSYGLILNCFLYIYIVSFSRFI